MKFFLLRANRVFYTSSHVQPIHPLMDQFREHLADQMANDFLWCYRGFVKIKCSECGIPDSVVWCQQCTDYFCLPCFLKLHKSARGKKHWPGREVLYFLRLVFASF